MPEGFQPREEVETASVARRYFEQLLSGNDEHIADELMHPEVEFYGPITPVGLFGIDDYKAFAVRWYKGFPDRQFLVDEEITEGERVAIKFTILGTHEGEFMGVPPTGNKIEIHGVNLFHLKDGKLHFIRAFFNPSDLLEPLGLDARITMQDDKK
jgi:steroid delta-isomerase-like uncharacterized protein